MSRISNLTSIRNDFYSSWKNDWYDKTYYNVLLFQDIKTRLYISGIFRRLESPTSYFHLKRDINNNFFLYSDVFLLNKIENSKYRSLYLEFSKYSYFCYMNYHSIYCYFFFKLKYFSYFSKINVGFNVDLDFTKLSKSKNSLLRVDSDKLLTYKLFYQKTNRNKMFKNMDIIFNSYISNSNELILNINEKFNILYNLNITREDSYSFIQSWVDPWFGGVEKNNTFYNNMLFFLLNYVNNLNTGLYKYENYLHNYIMFFKNISYLDNKYYNVFYNIYNNSLNKNKNIFIDKNNKLTESNKIINISNLTKNDNNFNYIFFFFINFIFLNNLTLFFYLLYYLKNKKTVLFFKSIKNSFFLSEWVTLKRFFYNHKKFLKRVSSFDKLKYKFINRTYYKKYINEYFLLFTKEMENTINFYLTKKKYNIYNVFLFFSFFEYKENQVPAIKDSKIVSDFILFQLHKFYSINRIFYELRDWQFKNYYYKRYNGKLYDLEEYRYFYNEKKYPVLGIKIECSGSYKPGSRKKKKYYGEVVKDVELVNKSPNNSFYADLDYYQSTARLKSGSIGIKVWVFFKTHLYNSNKHYISIVTPD